MANTPADIKAIDIDLDLEYQENVNHNFESLKQKDVSNMDDIASRYKAKEYISDLIVEESPAIHVVICKDGTTIDAGNLPLGTLVVVRRRNNG